MAGPILQGLLGGSLVLQGYGSGATMPSTSDASHLILQGFGGGSIVTQGYGGTAPTPPTTDHRTLYAQSATRKANAATIDPKRTAAARK